MSDHLASECCGMALFMALTSDMLLGICRGCRTVVARQRVNVSPVRVEWLDGADPFTSERLREITTLRHREGPYR